jgi:hypothetical protein
MILQNGLCTLKKIRKIGGFINNHLPKTCSILIIINNNYIMLTFLKFGKGKRNEIDERFVCPVSIFRIN